MSTIWLVEDEAAIADTLVYKLESEDYQVRWFERGELILQALKISVRQPPDLILLDVGLPDILGFDLAKLILAQFDIPIIFITARNDEIDRVIGLEIGADDYIAKPFSLREVVARVKCLLKRVAKQSALSTVTRIGPFFFNEQSANICYYEQSLNLTRYEYLLLKTFLLAPNRIFSRAQLMELIWHDQLNTMERTVDTHIKTIRQKLIAINNQTQPIQTHRGLGYCFTVL